LGLKLSKDLGNCFTINGDSLMIHDIASFGMNIFKRKLNKLLLPSEKRGINLYFETNEIENLYDKVTKNSYKIIHKIEKQPWEQRVFRLYDPDNYIVEIGEPLWLSF
jgi:uncharacterized glyoxalase superfamily protein PhnB